MNTGVQYNDKLSFFQNIELIKGVTGLDYAHDGYEIEIVITIDAAAYKRFIIETIGWFVDNKIPVAYSVNITILQND